VKVFVATRPVDFRKGIDGLALAVQCDLRISSANARFGIPINRIGHCLPYPAMVALVELAGRAAALEILLEGRILGAEEALAKGLVTRVVPDGPAALAGLAEGDVVVALDGVQITSMSSLVVALRTHGDGDVVTLTFVRDGVQRVATVTLTSRS